MDEHNNHGGSSSSYPPFLTKTYEMVNDSSSNSIVSWSQTNKSFIVWNPPEFSSYLLPKFFKHNNFSSFIRQLNTYGFRKSDPEKWEFANDDFVKDQPHLMKNIRRRKPVHSHSLSNLQAQQTPLMDSERLRMKNQIEKLTKEKESLLEKLHKQEEFEIEVKELKDRLQHMSKRQKTIVSLVSQVLKKPELDSNISPSCLPNKRKRRFPRILEDSTTLEMEELESSIATLENLVSESCESMMTLDIVESSTCPESPPLSSIQTCPKSPVIDMNTEPDVSKEQNNVASPAPITGDNDLFWGQFFDNSGPTKVQLERKDDKLEDRWSNLRHVNTVTEQLGEHMSS